MSVKAQVMSPWAGDGKMRETAFRPRVCDDYQIERFNDISGQKAEVIIPGPNLLVVEIECSAETLTTIESDLTYYIIWSES
jgi:hypothetical protein